MLRGLVGSEMCIRDRLEWACEIRANSVKDNDEFTDAAALLFPLSEAAPLMMGAKGAPVSLWHWRAYRPDEARNNPVSYTHLTLPTIYSV